MFLWFAVLAPVIVAEVFRSPRADYRLVALGALLPLGEAILGGPGVLHTLVGSLVALGLVMAVTVRRRLARRRWLGLPIGMLLHLVLDGTWADKELFWWPAFGWAFPNGPLPGFDRPVWLGVALELAALAVAWWAYRRYRLDDPENRALLVRAGQLAPGTVG